MVQAAKGKKAKTARKAEAPGNADLIFHGGKVYTVDGKRRWAQAVAVKRGKIVAVGSDAAIKKWRTPRTQLHDLQGRMMMPGLVDVHNHHTRGGQLDLFEVSFTSAHSYDNILKLVRARAEKTQAGEWMSALRLRRHLEQRTDPAPANHGGEG